MSEIGASNQSQGVKRTSKAISFFPWITVPQGISIGEIRLIPYSRGRSPGDVRLTSQREIDGVLKAYSIPPRKRVKEATLLEVGDWMTGMQAENHIADLFLARDILAFCGLANRRLFGVNHRYCAYFHIT